MCTIGDLKFQTCQHGENMYLALSANITPRTEELFSIDFTNKETNDKYIITTRNFYELFQQVAITYPVTKSKIEVLDHNGNTINIMPNNRTKNRCGTIPITIDRKIAFTEIVIPSTKINTTADYYIDLTVYEAFEQLSTDELKLQLITEDLIGFYGRYSNLNIKMILSKNVVDFINKNFKQLPENLEIIKTNEREDVINIVCEKIFGKIITRTNQISQGDLYFRIGEEVLTPIFVSTCKSNINWLLKAKSVQYTGAGEDRFIVLFEAPSVIMDKEGEEGDEEDEQIPLRITDEHNTQEFYSGVYSNNFDFVSIGMDKLIKRLHIYKGLSVISNEQIKSYIIENIETIVDTKSEVIEFSSVSAGVDEITIKNQIITLNNKIKDRMIGFWSNTPSNQVQYKRKAQVQDNGYGGLAGGLAGGFGGYGGFGELGGPRLLAQPSAGIQTHYALGRSITTPSGDV